MGTVNGDVLRPVTVTGRRRRQREREALRPPLRGPHLCNPERFSHVVVLNPGQVPNVSAACVTHGSVRCSGGLGTTAAEAAPAAQCRLGDVTTVSPAHSPLRADDSRQQFRGQGAPHGDSAAEPPGVTRRQGSNLSYDAPARVRGANGQDLGTLQDVWGCYEGLGPRRLVVLGARTDLAGMVCALPDLRVWDRRPLRYCLLCRSQLLLPFGW